MFEKIYKAYWQKVFRLCMGYVNDRELAQDLTQETFMVVFEKSSQFRNRAKIGTWIYRIASNICLRQIEKRDRFPIGKLPHQLPQGQQVDMGPEIAFLYRCIAGLPETDRLIISMALEGVRQEDIAEIIGISKVNVRVRTHRIKEKLRTQFKKNAG